MADLGGEFDTTIHVSNKFECLPEGEYELMVTKSEMKPNSKATGKVLTCYVTVGSQSSSTGRIRIPSPFRSARASSPISARRSGR